VGANFLPKLVSPAGYRSDCLQENRSSWPWVVVMSFPQPPVKSEPTALWEKIRPTHTTLYKILTLQQIHMAIFSVFDQVCFYLIRLQLKWISTLNSGIDSTPSALRPYGSYRRITIP